MLPDVNPEHVRGPTAERLDAVVGPPTGGKEHGTPRAKGVATERRREETMEPSEVPRAGGYRPLGVKPEVRVEAREAVTAGEVGGEGRDGIKWSGSHARNDNDIPVEEPITFMAREVIRQEVPGARRG